MQLNFIPDGKTKSQSIISGKVDAKAVNKGDKDDTEEKKAKKKLKEKLEKLKKKKKKEEGKEEEKNSEYKEDNAEKGEMYYLMKYRNNVLIFQLN